MRILVTNDDGMDSVGLHHLARAMTPFGEVVVAAPDREYSGASASLGALNVMHPEVHRIVIDGVDEAWAISGPPALCVTFARLGTFGPPFDLVVSGINPGANVGRSVYHSGTIGAALTARASGISGVAISQAVDDFGVEGQGWAEMLDHQHWLTAAEVAATVVGALVNDMPDEPVVLNVNVPNLPLEELAGWSTVEVGPLPPRSMSTARLVPKTGHDGTYTVEFGWGDPVELPPDTDGGALMANLVTLTWLTRLAGHVPDQACVPEVAKALDSRIAGPDTSR